MPRVRSYCFTAWKNASNTLLRSAALRAARARAKPAGSSRTDSPVESFTVGHGTSAFESTACTERPAVVSSPARATMRSSFGESVCFRHRSRSSRKNA